MSYPNLLRGAWCGLCDYRGVYDDSPEQCADVWPADQGRRGISLPLLCRLFNFAQRYFICIFSRLYLCNGFGMLYMFSVDVI